MKRFVEELIRPLLEQEMVTAVYGGGFKPPTKGHFDLVKTALKDYPEIDKFIIYVGGGVRDGITQEQSLKIWETYKELLPGKKIEIIPSAQPIGDVKRYAKDHPDETVYFIIGYREGREDDLMDIASRTKGAEEKYPNLKVKVIQTPAGDMSGTNARKALRNNNPEKFFTYLPEDVPQPEKQEIYDLLQPSVLEEGDPKVGTGKKPKGSYRRLYTDEDPSDTVKVKFSTKQDIIDTLSKASFKSKSHVRQSQIINLIHQRVRAAYERAKDPEVKKRLKTALDYAEQRKEASKEKTERLKKENVAPNHTGKSSPFGSGYKEMNEVAMPSLYEDVKTLIPQLTQYMYNQGMEIKPFPKVTFVHDDAENAQNVFGKTAYYDPNNYTVVLYTMGRHPKDILRSFAHEMIHHEQNMKGTLGNIQTTNTTEDDHLDRIEREAYEKGNIMFRNWTDSLREDGQKTSIKNMDDYKKQNSKEQLNELAIAPLLIKGLIGIITTVGAGLIKAFGSIMVDRVIDGAILIYQDIKNIVAPEPYIKFLKGLEKNDKFNKEFIELTLSQRKPGAKVLLGTELEEAMTSLPAFVEAFDKFTAEENISGDAKRFLLARIQRSMREAYMSGWRDIHKVLKKKYPELTKDLNEQQLNEGRYDKFTNELSRLAFELFKDGYTVGKKVVDETFTVGPADEDPDIISDDFEFDFYVQAVYTDDTYTVDGGANAGYDDKKDEITPLLSVRFEIPKDIDWQTVSFDLKDVIRHELEHLTQDGANLRPGKKMEDDEFIRDMINADLLPKSDYFKLAKEVDAMLQGMYLKAKKSKRPFIEVIDDYLDKQPITQEERKEILDLWAKRIKNIGLPMFEQEEAKPKKYTIFCDMDGVLVDFDEGYKQLTGVTTQHADSQGKDEFWKLFRDSLKEKGISERSYWENLDWMPDGKQLWDYIKQYNPYVLTAPSVNMNIPFEDRYKLDNNESMQGKTEWAQRLPNLRKLYFRSAGRKADFAGPNKILIDDRADTIQKWNNAGGIGILHKNTSDTIQQLKDLGL
jgi:hypothetical protein